jgi:exodeoxyribonuclease VII large subunit
MAESAGRRWEREWRGRRAVREVAEVGRSIATDLRQRYPERLFVRGTVEHSDLRPEGASFTLVGEDPERGLTGRVEVVLDELHRASVLDEIADAGLRPEHLFAEGQPIVVGGRLSYRPERNRLEVRLETVDVAGTEALLAEARERARAELAAAGLDSRQAALALPVAPTRVGIVGAASSAAVAVLLDTLSGRGFQIRHRVYEAALEGNGATVEIARAITAASGDGHLLVFVVRDDGDRFRLVPFDAEPVARAVALCPVPVITGIGTGDTLAEQVAFRACASPEAAGAVVLERLEATLDLLERQEARLRKAAYAALARARVAHESASVALAEAGAAARQRAASARRRRGIELAVLAAVVVVALVALVAIARPPATVVAGLAVLLAAVAGFYALFRRRPAGVADPAEDLMTADEMSFEQAVSGLDGIRERLEVTDQPEVIEQLMRRADELSRHCRQLLGRAGEAIAVHEAT